MTLNVRTEHLPCGCIYSVERLSETPSYNGDLIIKQIISECQMHRMRKKSYTKE